MNILATYRKNIFTSVEDMDAAVDNHIYYNADKLSDNYRKILRLLASYSLKSLGTAHLKYATIAEHIGCSRVTVVRAIKRLKELGIIDVTKGKKLNGIQGADYFHILNFDHEVIMRTSQQETIQRAKHETPRSSKVEHVKNESESLYSFKALSNPSVKSVNTYGACASNDDLKRRLKDVYKPSTVEGNQIFKELLIIAYGRLKQGLKRGVPYTQMTDLVVKCMQQLLAKKDVRNPFAMYSKMIERQTNQLFERSIQPSLTRTSNSLTRSEAIPDWFNERNEPVMPSTNDVDFEAERQKILAKLG